MHIHECVCSFLLLFFFCLCVRVCTFCLETTAACARYPHNVGQVYNMVIRDLWGKEWRWWWWLGVVTKGRQEHKKREIKRVKKNNNKMCHFFYSGVSLLSCVCVSGLSGPSQPSSVPSASQASVANQKKPHNYCLLIPLRRHHQPETNHFGRLTDRGGA